MTTYKLNFQFGSWEGILKNAFTQTDKHEFVEFEFNGVQVIVSTKTDPILLWRDFTNYHLLGWKTIGPDCMAEYPPSVQKQLSIAQSNRDERRKKEEEESEKKDKAEKESFQQKTAGVNIEISDQASWDKYKEVNKDGYGAAIIEYAEGWAKLMQVEMASGKKLVDIASKTSFEMGFMGISGFMYGAAVATLAESWKHGEELRKWHNKEYKHEGEGVVNPAILTVS